MERFKKQEEHDLENKKTPVNIRKQLTSDESETKSDRILTRQSKQSYMRTDSTPRKNREEALKESEEQYRTLYNDSMDALMVLEPPEWNFTSGNSATIEMFKAKDEKEFISMPPWKLSPEYQPDGQISSVKANNMIAEAMKKGSNFFKWTHRRMNGEVFPAMVLLTRVKLKGEYVVQATVRDITEQNKADLEREKLHIQAKERLVMIQKQNIQLINLQKKLKGYANKLEMKVKKLEESNLNLTFKEKILFCNMVMYPDLNDRELAERTKLKRSTVTAIKNRLKKEKLYTELNVPNLSALGCGLFTVIYGKLNKRPGELNRMKEKFVSAEFLFLHTTETDFFAVTATKDFVTFHKDITPSLVFATNTHVFKEYPSIAQFPLELSVIREFFNFAPALSEAFHISEELINSSAGERPVSENNKTLSLTKNAKDILYAMIKYPQASVVELAKMLRLTRVTVSRIKCDLFKQEAVKKVIIPDINCLNYSFITICHFKHVPGTTVEMVKKFNKTFNILGSTTYFAAIGTSESMCGILSEQSREQAEHMRSLIREMKIEGIITEEPVERIFFIHETRQFRFNFAPITKKMVGI